MSERRTWVIDVCRTCERLAQWPFCEHRDTWTGPRSWYVSVTVTGRMPKGVVEAVKSSKEDK